MSLHGNEQDKGHRGLWIQTSNMVTFSLHIAYHSQMSEAGGVCACVPV